MTKKQRLRQIREADARRQSLAESPPHIMYGARANSVVSGAASRRRPDKTRDPRRHLIGGRATGGSYRTSDGDDLARDYLRRALGGDD